MQSIGINVNDWIWNYGLIFIFRMKRRVQKEGKVKLRFNRRTSQNCKSIKRILLKINLELLKRNIV